MSGGWIIFIVFVLYVSGSKAPFTLWLYYLNVSKLKTDNYSQLTVNKSDFLIFLFLFSFFFFRKNGFGDIFI